MRGLFAALAGAAFATVVGTAAHAENFTFDLSGTGYFAIFGQTVATSPNESFTGEIYGLSSTGSSSATDLTVNDPFQGTLDYGPGGDFTVTNGAITAASFSGLAISSEISGAYLTLANNTGDYDAGVLYYGYGIDGGTVTYASAVPEPATWAFMILGIGGIGVAFRQAKRKNGLGLTDAVAA